MIIGTISALDDAGCPLVDYHGNPAGAPLKAVSTLGITQKHIARHVALLFANGDLTAPVIVGVIHSPLQELLDNYELTPAQDKPEKPENESITRIDDVLVDGKRVVLEGKDEIVLQCGEASITLTKAGKILIRGKYLLNRATGVNRILGGSVQVN
ncbi:MAG: hypothetical protein GC149_18705 [Gammaproteobacteria bacterium]|nr:hypothetical protein [Gammaproteobacteria bacterium]